MYGTTLQVVSSHSIKHNFRIIVQFQVLRMSRPAQGVSLSLSLDLSLSRYLSLSLSLALALALSLALSLSLSRSHSLLKRGTVPPATP